VNDFSYDALNVYTKETILTANAQMY